MEFEFMNEFENFKQTKDEIIITAGKGTNLFHSMLGTFQCNNFPFYYTQFEGDFVIRCKVSVEFDKIYDLGCLVVYAGEDQWMKLAYENSDTGNPAIVSVVTRGISDDCNGEAVSGSVWLQICRKGNAFSMHYSQDSVEWKLVRIFAMDMGTNVKVGISAQCPMGDSCTVHFEGLEIKENPYENIRSLK